MIKAVGISGSPRSPSKSRLLVERVLGQLGEGGAQVRLLDLAALPADALLGRVTDPNVAPALDAAAQAQIVVAGTPVYRAPYTRLLKTFFDLFARDALAGVVGVPVVTGSGPDHTLAVDHGLRPLFASLGARTIAAAIYATDSQFPNGAPEPALVAAVERATREAEEIAHRVSLS